MSQILFNSQSNSWPKMALIRGQVCLWFTFKFTAENSIDWVTSLPKNLLQNVGHFSLNVSPIYGQNYRSLVHQTKAEIEDDFVVHLAPDYGRNWGWFCRSFSTKVWQKLRTISNQNSHPFRIVSHQSMATKMKHKNVNVSIPQVLSMLLQTHIFKFESQLMAKIRLYIPG